MKPGVVPAADKARWSGQFVAAYLGSPGLDPEMARDLARHVPAGPEAPAPARGRAAVGKAGIQWVRIPGGTFTMGADDLGATPRHSVAVKSFQMAKTEVTNKQYRACVEAGACTPQGSGCGSYSSADDQPVVCAGSVRVNRGGSWGLGAGNFRAAFRSNDGPGCRNDSLGLRPAR